MDLHQIPHRNPSPTCRSHTRRLCTFDEASTPKFPAFSSLISIFLRDLRNSRACACSSTTTYRPSNETNGENPPTPRSCTYRQSNSSLIDINIRKTVRPSQDKVHTIDKDQWSWTPTDSNSTLKRKRDDLGTIYVSNAENLDISHVTVMSATLPACKIIRIDAYHMDTQGRKPGNCKGLTPPRTRKDLRRPVARSTLSRNGVKTSLQTTSTFPPTCRKMTSHEVTPPNDTTTPPVMIGALMEH